MKNALIGYSGFVGSTLLKQNKFDSLYRSTNIEDIKGSKFDLVVCAGAPAQKWLANKEPVRDAEIIGNLISCLNEIDCEMFILISTVDVFKEPIKVDEDTQIETQNLHAYGLNRYRLEQFVQEKFKHHLIIRLPGLVGPGLRKNIIFDFHNNNEITKIESRNAFQFYPMVNLWSDIEKAIDNNIKLVHLTAEPISVAQIAKDGFGFTFDKQHTSKLVTYDMRSKYASLFGGAGVYQYTNKETIQAIRHYAQSEPKKYGIEE